MWAVCAAVHRSFLGPFLHSYSLKISSAEVVFPGGWDVSPQGHQGHMLPEIRWLWTALWAGLS